MKSNAPTLLTGAAALAAVATLLTGCSAKNDTISQAEKGQKDAPGFAETRAMAEQGFIYGLPLVMNYAVVYDYFVDRTSWQWKAPGLEVAN